MRASRVGCSVVFGFCAGLTSLLVAADPVCEAARVIEVQGTVEVRHDANSAWRDAPRGTALCAGDQVRVLANSRAALVFPGALYVRLDQNTSVILPAAGGSSMWLKLRSGAAHFISRLRQRFGVQTPFVNAVVEGTKFQVAAGEDSGIVTVLEGHVQVENPAGRLSLTRGQQAEVIGHRAPTRHTLVKPWNAVQWTLYYPTILNDQQIDSKIPLGPLRQPWQAARTARKQGDIDNAINALRDLPQVVESALLYGVRANLHLQVGRVSEARDDLTHALELNPNEPSAWALRALMAVVDDDHAVARAFAEQAVTHDPAGAAPALALSYVRQAEFDLAGALAALDPALAVHVDHTFLWSRRAELLLALGRVEEARQAAYRAMAVDPNAAQALIMVGFSELIAGDEVAALATFNRALALNAEGSLARLGLGLALVRHGELIRGRAEIEAAVSLDPHNALLRSYLGKAYFEEQQASLASDQFDIAKELDPADPTPWLYGALQKQSQNRPIEALADLDRSIELNDRRAVYRSRFLLDQDLAVRSTDIAGLYRSLGFNQLALVQGSRSLAVNPNDFATHRFMADIYAALPRHEIARQSELLQSRLLQPLNSTPLDAQLSDSSLALNEGVTSATPSYNEYASLFTRDGVRGKLVGSIGDLDIVSDSATVGGLHGRYAWNASQFAYRSDGFRANNDLNHDLLSLFGQADLNSASNVQVEWFQRRTESGDITQRLPDVFFPDDRRENDIRRARLGYRHTLGKRE